MSNNSSGIPLAMFSYLHFELLRFQWKPDDEPPWLLLPCFALQSHQHFQKWKAQPAEISILDSVVLQNLNISKMRQLLPTLTQVETEFISRYMFDRGCPEQNWLKVRFFVLNMLERDWTRTGSNWGWICIKSREAGVGRWFVVGRGERTFYMIWEGKYHSSCQHLRHNPHTNLYRWPFLDADSWEKLHVHLKNPACVL